MAFTVMIDDEFINKLIELTKCNKIKWSYENGVYSGYYYGKPYFYFSEDCKIYEYVFSYELIFDSWCRKEYKWSKNKLVKTLYNTIQEQRLQDKISKSSTHKENFMKMQCPEKESS
jgi:hypothetical protein